MKKLQIGIYIFVLLFITIARAEKLKKKSVPTGAPPKLRKVNIANVTVKRLAKPIAAGDTTFYFREDINGTELIEVPFYKKYSDDLINIFVEVSEFDSGRVTGSEIDTIADRLVNRTPEGSINPDKGIYANEIDVVGEPSDVDNNGKLNVLLIDVRDDYKAGSSESYVAGYFDPLDQMASKGNYAEIIYIDTNPADLTSNFVHTIVAHELQHLIHYNYDEQETEWLNEGMSVLIPKVLGFEGRSFGDFISNPNNRLNKFDNTLEDYAKVGLWSYYVYKRFGIDFISEVIQSELHSLSSYNDILTTNTDLPSIREVMRDWFIANLINNPDIKDGIYGYGGTPLPEIRTNHFYSNFTEGEYKNITLNSGAAEYIQFYEGQNINFEMEHDINNYFGMAVIKHKTEPEISILDMEEGTYTLSDKKFGSDYFKISFIPFLSSMSAVASNIDITYKATGEGGTREKELAYDDDEIKYYITLDGVEAGEKFKLPANTIDVNGVKFKMYESCQATIKIYEDMNSQPVKVFEDVAAPGKSWKRLELEEGLIKDTESLLVSVTSDEALGYSDTQSGAGRAYLKNEPNGSFHSLDQFELSDGTVLKGNWSIRAVVSVSSAPTLTLSPDTLNLVQGERSSNFTIINDGIDALNWEIDTTVVDWLTLSPAAGNVTNGENEVNIEIDRNKLTPGENKVDIPIYSNAGTDSLHVSVLVSPASMAFSKESIYLENGEENTSFKIINEGTQNLNWEIDTTAVSWLSFSPNSGSIAFDESKIEVNIDRSSLNLGENVADIPVISNAGTDSIRITVLVTPASLALSTHSISLENNETDTSFTIINEGTRALNWEIDTNLVDWLSFEPAFGSVKNNESKVDIIVKRDALAAGTNQANIPILSNAGTDTLAVSVSATPPTIALSKHAMFIKSGELNADFTITNEGTIPLKWEIDTTRADWLIFSPHSGNLAQGSKKINVTVDRVKMKPGLAQTMIPVISNAATDSIYISVIKRNTNQPQAVVWADSTDLNKKDSILTIKLYNIGTGGSEFAFSNSHPALSFSPPSGIIPVNNKGESDTLDINVFINHNFVNKRKLDYTFFDGLDTVQKELYYSGTISDTSAAEYALQLEPPFPNPMNMKQYNAINIRFTIPERGKGQISIFNILGQRIKTYRLRSYNKGDNIVQWKAKNDRGEIVSSGVYFVQLKYRSQFETRKMLLIK